ncbi:MAG: protein kinase [Desulfobacteraceae bacterium]|nr:protein kinase [Desulfobacteraceae bacterium]
MKLKKIFSANTSVITFMAVVILLGMLSGVSPLGFTSVENYKLMLGNRKPANDSAVVVVRIDDKSIDRYGIWPIPRSRLADAISLISKAGADAIGISDIHQHQWSDNAVVEIKALQKQLDDKSKFKSAATARKWQQSFKDAAGRLDQDSRLIAAVKSARNIVLPFEFLAREPDGSAPQVSPLLVLNSQKVPEEILPGSDIRLGRVRRIDDYWHASEHIGAIRETFRDLAGKAGALGHLNVSMTSDRRMIDLPLLIEYDGRFFPSLSLQLAAKYFDTQLNNISIRRTKSGMASINLRRSSISTDSGFSVLLDAHAAGDRIPVVSLADVLDASIPGDLFAGKVVIIGMTSNAGFHARDLGGSLGIPSAIAHAAAVDALLTGGTIHRPAWAGWVEVAVLIYFALFLMFIIPRVNVRLGGFILVFFLMTWVATVAFAFKLEGVWLCFVPALLMSLAGFAYTSVKNHFSKYDRRIAGLNQTLGRIYLSQGQLDMAFDALKASPVEDGNTRQIFYDLGLEFERKRMFNQAVSVYERITSVGKFKDLDVRLKKLRNAGTLLLGPNSDQASRTLSFDSITAAPTFGRYTIIQELGQGAMGTVYLGKDPKIKREVAIKTLDYSAVAADEIEEVKYRFFHEAETAGKLSHPNIVTVYDIGEERDIAYIAMELLDGDDLTVYCQKDKLLPKRQVLTMIAQVADALNYAHGCGVVHRDIKPGNIMLLKSGQVKVTDFGIARVMDNSKTRTGIVLGTPNYMSPEQVDGKKVDGRSDLFSLGIVFYEMLTGEKPFKGDSITSLMYAIAKENYTPLSAVLPGLAPCCVEIVEKLMKKGLTKRYQSPDKLKNDINACLAQFDGDQDG